MIKHDFGQLPFVYAPLQLPSNGKFPDYLPFCLQVEPSTGLITQTTNADVAETLHKAYIASSKISGMMDSCGIGKEYADDFLSYIIRQSGREDFSGCRILEIGCGTGYLLHLLQERGADVVGLEPGMHGQEGAARFGVSIIRDFFPSVVLSDKFDLIIAYGLLEHILHFSVFFDHVTKQLVEDGLVVFAVPDCGPYLRVGDISFLFHEHWSYFTIDSLKTTIHQYSRFCFNVQEATFGGTLYASCRKSQKPTYKTKTNALIGKELFKSFIEKSCVASERFLETLQGAERLNQSVGIFVPGRAVNVLASLKDSVNFSMLRFFDDNKMLQGKYFPGFTIKVESRQDLISNPPDKLIIMSRTFGDKIVLELRAEAISSEIVIWDDIYLK